MASKAASSRRFYVVPFDGSHRISLSRQVEKNVGDKKGIILVLDNTVRDNTKMNGGSAASPPPLPPRPHGLPEVPRLPGVNNRRRSSAPTSPERPPKPPCRGSSLSGADLDDFEARFRFHPESKFPQPDTFSNGKKTYSSVLANKHTATPSSPPPQPPVQAPPPPRRPPR